MTGVVTFSRSFEPCLLRTCRCPLSFMVNREFNGNKLVIKYAGTIKGDTFKGKRDLERDGETNTREFEAKRVKE